MSSLWNGISSIENLVLHYDTSEYPLPGTIVPCLMCAKPYLMRRYSGIPDQVCPECFETYKDCAKLTCNKCKVVIARVKPGVTDSGYHIRRRAVLHIDACTACNPGIRESVVIEITEWELRVGRTRKIIIPFSNPKE